MSYLCITHKDDDIFLQFFLNDSFSSELAYTSQPYTEVMAIRSAMSYIPFDKSSRGKTGDITTFTHFEEGNLYLKLMMIQKVATYMMTIQLSHQ